MHLRYCMYSAPMGKHPLRAMEDLGIKYQHATPQSIADQWWFWNCKVPAPLVLPPYLTELKVRAEDAVGNGLSSEMAEKIKEQEDVE